MLWRQTSERQCFILDTTNLAKRGKSFENLTFVYDPGQQRTVPGYELLVLGLLTPRNFFPLDYGFHFSRSAPGECRSRPVDPLMLHWSSGEASCPLGWKLYLPKEWCEDLERRAKVKIPPEVEYRTKSELALELVDQMLTWGVPSRPVVANSFYANEFCFQEQLRRRGLHYALQVKSSTVAWDTDPNLPLPALKRTGRPRKHPPL